MVEYVILVDENDAPTGRAEKMEAHEKGLLHRAFSVFVSNSKGEILLQKRALTKYHSAGLWTNTCCSHPRPSEDIMEAAHRRLQEEMGFDCDLHEIFKFKYSAKLEAGLSENEIDHVLVGIYEKDPVINPDEVDEFKWAPIDWLIEDVKNNPDSYTVWFKICFKEVLVHTSTI